MEKLKLDHDATTLAEAFGLSDYDKNYIVASIIFETINGREILKNDWKGLEDDAPLIITATSGLLERAMNHVNTRQLPYLLLVFQTYKDKTIHLYEVSTTAKAGKGHLLKALMGMSGNDINKEINAYRKFGGNFDKWAKWYLMEKELERDAAEPDPEDDLDRIIKNALRKKPDDEE